MIFFLTKYFFSSDVNLPNFIAREQNKKRLEEWEGGWRRRKRKVPRRTNKKS
jgi:hypothetical protein